MAAYNTPAAAAALVNVLSDLGIPAQLGAPEAVQTRLTAWVTLGGQVIERKHMARTQRRTRFFVMLMYRVDRSEDTAEAQLMGVVDQLVAAIQADYTLGGVVDDAQINSMAADEPDYQARAGREYREYPFIVEVTQRDGFEVNP